MADRKTSRKSLKINARLNTIKTVSGILFPLITFPYISRILSVDSVGAYNFSVSVISYCTLIAGLGISSYAIREGSQYRDNPQLITRFVSEIFTLNIISTIIAYIILAICIIFVPKINSYSTIICILSLEVVFTTIGVNWVCNIYEDFAFIAIRTIVFQFLSLIATFVFVKTQDDILKYVIIVVFASSGASLMNFFYIRKRYVNFKLIFNNDILKHLKAILIIFSSTVTITLYVNSDITILGFLMTDTDVGLYSASVKIYTIAKNVLVSIIVVLIPRFSILFTTRRLEEANALFSKVLDTVTALVFPVTVGLFMTSNDVILLLAGGKYAGAGSSLRILSIATMFSLFAYIYTNCVLLPLKKEKIILYASLVSAIVNIIFNIVMIPVLGINAAAITTVLAEANVFGIALFCSRNAIKIYGLKKDLISVLLGCIGIIVTCILARSINRFVIRLVVEISISCIVYFFILLLCHNSVITEYYERFKTKIGSSR